MQARLAILLSIGLFACRPEAKARLIYKDAQGRELTAGALEGVTGRVNWEIVGSMEIPPEARALHEKGRALGSKGDNEGAIANFLSAQRLAPEWPHPVYDAAYAYLLMNDIERALPLYQKVNSLAPRGFFNAKSEFDCVQREAAGKLPTGFCAAFVKTEWIDNPASRRAVLAGVVAKFPGFAPAWKELSGVLESDDERAMAIERGLAANPDPETAGMLLINKAILLNGRGDHDGAVRALGDLALDPKSTLATEVLAKATLANILSRP